MSDDLGATVSNGARWCGRDTLRGSVASVCFEADALSLRLCALADKWALEDVYVLRASDPISPLVARDGLEEPSIGERFVTGALQRLVVSLAEAGRPPVVLVKFDTVRASLSGSEDSTENVSAYLRAVRRIMTAAPAAFALLLHHAGWQDGEAKRKRERGSSAFRGNVDATLYLEAEDGEDTVSRCVNMKSSSQTDGIYHAPYQPGQATLNRDDVRLYAELPGGGGHSSRSVAIGPDGRVYASLGISGNCSDQYLDESYAFNHRRGGVLVLDEPGDKPRWKVFGSGLRNPVGYAWHPRTAELYASNNGPDHHGFEQPPEYFSRILPGSFHGTPWFQFDGTRVQRDDCIERTPPRPSE